MTPGQEEMIKDLEDLLTRAKAWEFLTPNPKKDKKPIFALRETLSDIAARAIYGKYNQ